MLNLKLNAQKYQNLLLPFKCPNVFLLKGNLINNIKTKQNYWLINTFTSQACLSLCDVMMSSFYTLLVNSIPDNTYFHSLCRYTLLFKMIFMISCAFWSFALTTFSNMEFQYWVHVTSLLSLKVFCLESPGTFSGSFWFLLIDPFCIGRHLDETCACERLSLADRCAQCVHACTFPNVLQRWWSMTSCAIHQYSGLFLTRL